MMNILTGTLCFFVFSVSSLIVLVSVIIFKEMRSRACARDFAEKLFDNLEKKLETDIENISKTDIRN